MNKIKALALLIVVLFFCAANVQAQNSDPLEEYFYASGKIKVVIAVLGVILAGLFGFLFYLERRISKWEKQEKH
jgi:uncharacterized membrane protein YciS (DUF1049 family)